MSELNKSFPTECRESPTASSIGSPTVFLVDPDPAMRTRVQSIADSLSIRCAFADCGEEFLRDCQPALGPGCLISEFRLRGINGLELQAELHRRGANLPIIFVTAFAETTLTVQAMQQGAVHVLEKPFSQQMLCDLLWRAFENSQQIWRIDQRHQAVRQRLSLLTSKEQQVLQKILAGRSNKQIAIALDISVRTVEARRHEIFKKTGTTSVAELVRTVLEISDQDARS